MIHNVIIVKELIEVYHVYTILYFISIMYKNNKKNLYSFIKI